MAELETEVVVVDPKETVAAATVETTTKDEDIQIPQSFLDKIDKDLEDEGGSPDEKKDEKHEQKEPSEFEKFKGDPLNALYLEFRESGEDDFKAFLEKGGIDFSTPTVESLIRTELAAEGLKGDKLDAAVERRVSAYEDLTEGEQEIEMNKLNKVYSSKRTGKLIEHAQQIQSEKARIGSIQEKAIGDLEAGLNQFVGKKYMNLVSIPVADREEIKQVAKNFAMPIIENGKIVGYDVKSAIDLAITHKYGKQAIKEAKKSAYVEAYKEIMKEKKNISQGETKTQQAKTSELTKEEALRKLRQGA